jgi:hypothetical protein
VKRALLLLLPLGLALSCVKTVDPAADTGEDGEYDGSTQIDLDNTLHGETEDTVSYPGGDRVDWFSVDVGKTIPGTLTVTLSYTGPRKGADLSYKVYAEWGALLGEEKPRKHPPNTKHGHRESKARPAFGTVYIEVYASRPMDAGDYTLKVAFLPDKPKFPPLDDFPLPPTLSAVYPKCTADNWDKENPDCKEMKIPDPNGPKPPPPTPCDMNNPDPNNPDCLQKFPVCDVAALDCKNPNCAGKSEDVTPVVGDIVAGPDADGAGSVLTVNVGTDLGLTKQWKGYLVDSQETQIENSDLTLKKPKKTASDWKVPIKPGALPKGLTAHLFPPAKSCPAPKAKSP